MSIKAYEPVINEELKIEILSTVTDDNARSNSFVVYQDKLQEEEIKINPDDVDQGALGDCYFLSSVESLALFDPTEIYGGKDSIIQGPDKKGIYIVQLYVPDEKNRRKKANKNRS